MFNKRKKEKSLDDIINEIESKKVSVEKKTLEDFSKEFQPEILKISSVLLSSENDTHIKVSEKMFELLKRKWDSVLTTSTTLSILFNDEEKRFNVLVSNTIERIKVLQRETRNGEFCFIDMNTIGLD